MSEKATIIVFSGELDKLLAAFTIATGAASAGMEVSMFFTFWGLNVLRKERSAVKPKNILKRMMSMMNRGGADNLKLSRFNMAGMGTAAMKKLMKDSRMPSIAEMLVMSKDLGVKIMACTTSMEIMGVDKRDLVAEVDTLCGVAAYLAEAKDSKINLFI